MLLLLLLLPVGKKRPSPIVSVEKMRHPYYYNDHSPWRARALSVCHSAAAAAAAAAAGS